MRSLFVGIAILALSVSGANSQSTTESLSDFSGSWSMDRARSESAMQEVPAGVVSVTIKQTPSILVIDTTRDTETDSKTYPMTERPSRPTEVIGQRRAFWDGPMLVNEGSVNINGQTIAFLESRLLSADGAEMSVETTLKVEHGYELRGAKTVVRGKNVFVRSR